MGSLTPLEAAFFSVLLTLFWLLIGACFVSLWRRDLMDETFAALFNMLCWPLGALTQWLIFPLVRRRKEKARQARLEYAVEHARHLGWKD